MTSGVFICGAVLDRYVKKMKATGGMKPEHRLPVMVFGSPTLPIGLFLYGWSAQKHTHWIFPVLGTAILGFGVAVTIVPTSSYLVDAFGIHAASAIAAMITMRCIVGALLPLAGKMFPLLSINRLV
jgi:MFS family permease